MAKPGRREESEVVRAFGMSGGSWRRLVPRRARVGLAFIVAGCAVVGSVGIKVLAEWHSVSSSMDGPKAAVVADR